MKIGVILVRSNEVNPDPRVEKTVRWLCETYSVKVLAWNRTLTSKAKEDFIGDSVIHRQNNKAHYGSGVKNIFALIKFNIWVFRWLYLHRHSYALIHACDMDTILPCLMIKWLFKKKVVYDIFDYFSESRAIGGLTGKIINCLENFCIRQSDALIIVDHNRYTQLKTELPALNGVVYNVPDLPMLAEAPAVLKNRIAYVGILQPHRFLLEMCDLLSRKPDWELVIAGFGPLEEKIKTYDSKYPNIHFLGRVSYEQGLELNQSAKVMVAVYDPVIPNHRYASPNKLFEALALGKILIAANDTAIDQKIKQYGIGYNFSYTDPDAFLKILSEVEKLTIAELNSFKDHGQQAFKEYYLPEVQINTLKALYSKVLVN